MQVQCGDASVETKIEDKINQLYAWVEKHPGKRGQVNMSLNMGLSVDVHRLCTT